MSFTFDSVSSTTYLSVNRVRHSILPTLSPRSISVPGRAGAYDFGVDMGVREIQVDVTIKGTSMSDLRTKVRSIAGWLFKDVLKPLTFSDEPSRTYYARVIGNTDLDDLMEAGQGTITFLCPSSFADGATQNLTIPSAGGTLTNDGTAKTAPIFTVTFTASSTNFKISKGSEFVYVLNNFVNGNTLEVDCLRNVVKINGARAMDKLDLTSVFFVLDPGSNEILFTPTSGFTCSCTFTEKHL